MKYDKLKDEHISLQEIHNKLKDEHTYKISSDLNHYKKGNIQFKFHPYVVMKIHLL